MAGLSFAFRASGRTPLAFRWPLEAGVRGQLRNPRYRWTPPPPVIVGVLRNPRYRMPLAPFPGFLPPANVRAGLAASSMRAAALATATPTSGWAESRGAGPLLGLPTGDAALLPSEQRALCQDTAPLGKASRLAWGEGAERVSEARLLLRRIPPHGVASQAVWRDGERCHQDVGLAFVRAWMRTTAPRWPWREAVTRGTGIGHDWRSAPPLGRLARVPWRGARRRSGLSWPGSALLPLPPIPPRAALRFHFHAPVFAPLAFHFGRPPAWVIPILRSYRMVHDIEVVRLPDRTEIPVTALTLSSAWDEWSWSFSAALAGSEAVDLLRPIVTTPVEIEVTVDGNTWQFRLDQVSGSSQFARTSGQTQGRGRVALLGPDVALAVNGYETEAKTARQLAEQELTGTNWQLEWPETFPDWLVPARTFSYTQKTPIEVISQIVATAGGRILADAALDWIRVRPRYPAAPWTWSALQPDILLPRSILTTLAWKPRLGQPWDAVYLGDGADVLAKVKRTGLPGVSLPDSPTIEPLLCHLDACRGRGTAMLSDAIAGVDFTLALPLSAAAGPSPLRAVGELARFEDGGKPWIGLITAVTVQVGFGAVAQTLEVRAVELPT